MGYDPRAVLLLIAVAASVSAGRGGHGKAEAFDPTAPVFSTRKILQRPSLPVVGAPPLLGVAELYASAPPGENSSSATPAAPEQLQKAPTLNGKMVFPLKALAAGLEGHNVAAVYAVLNSQYKRGAGEGWEHCEYVGVTRDLGAALRSHSNRGSSCVAHIRALSFAYPQRSAMEEFASRWRARAGDEGGKAAAVGKDWEADLDEEINNTGISAAEVEKRALLEDMESEYFDEDEDEEFDLTMDVVDKPDGESVISPFAEGAAPTAGGSDVLVFSRESVDKVLDEVRPYLISDGGNVSVQSVDEETKNVYLVLEGACGSCSSSTVTMQLGIERVLKENFPELGEVIEVEDPSSEADKPTELTLEAVEEELSRIKPAIIAMGGVVEIVSVDPLGVVELSYRGSNKLQQGLELAIMDVPFVKHVKFVS